MNGDSSIKALTHQRPDQLFQIRAVVFVVAKRNMGISNGSDVEFRYSPWTVTEVVS